MKKQKMKLLSCILMGIGSIIGASVFATTPIAIKIIGGNGIVVGFICALFNTDIGAPKLSTENWAKAINQSRI